MIHTIRLYPTKWLRQMSITMLYSGEIPLDQIQAEFSTKTGNQIDVLENMENEAAA